MHHIVPFLSTRKHAHARHHPRRLRKRRHVNLAADRRPSTSCRHVIPHGQHSNRQLDGLHSRHPSLRCYPRRSRLKRFRESPSPSFKMASFQDRAQHTIAQLDKEVRSLRLCVPSLPRPLAPSCGRIAAVSTGRAARAPAIACYRLSYCRFRAYFV